ncbi:hypothetical protein LINPERPRIM_LOCUS20093 [Linum perenne]
MCRGKERSSFKIHADEEIQSNCYSLSVNPEGSFNGSDNNDENVLIADVVPEELDLMMEMASEDAKEDSTKSEKPDALDGGFLKFFVLSNSVSVEISKVQVSEIWSGAGEVPDEAAGKPWRKSKVRSLDPAALKSWFVWFGLEIRL